MILNQTEIQSSSSKIGTNAVSNLATNGLDMVIQIVLIRFILGQLSEEVFGIWVIVGGVFAYSALMQLGINSAVNYFIPWALNRNDKAAFNRTVNTAIVFYGMVSTIVGGLTVVLTAKFPQWFHIREDLAISSQILVAMTGLYFCISIPLSVLQGVLSGMQKYVQMNAVRAAWRLGRAALILIMLFFDLGLIGLGLAHVVARLGESITITLLAMRKAPHMRIAPSLASETEFKKMISYSLQTLLWSLSYTIRDRLGIIVIGLTMAPTAVAIYAIPIMIMQAFYSLIQAFASVTKPAASSFLAQQKHLETQKLVLRGNRLVASLVFPVFIFLLIFGKPLIVIWINQFGFESAWPLLIVLISGELFTMAQLVSAYVLIGMGRQGPVAYSSLGVAASSALLMFVSAKFTNLGLWGIALASGIPALIYGSVFIPLFTCRTIQCKFSTYINNTLARPLGASAPFAIVLATISMKSSPQTAFDLGGVILISIPALIFGVYFSSFTHTERKSIKFHLNSFRSKIPWL